MVIDELGQRVAHDVVQPHALHDGHALVQLLDIRAIVDAEAIEKTIVLEVMIISNCEMSMSRAGGLVSNRGE